MNARSLTVVFALLSLAAWAASDGSDTEERTVQKAWFDGGISNDWPNATTKFGGEWTGNPTNTFDGTAVTLAPNDRLVFELGSAEQNGHTFGWQFGNYQLRGANAIREELSKDEEPLPNPQWPAEMEPHAIFFGGTDPGRFVPTYMIYSALFRPDVYLITQNALADDTYMSVERDLYGDEIWIPLPSLKPEDKVWRGVVDVCEKGTKAVRRVAFPEDYPFVTDGKKRSPWYDRECSRAVNPVEIAQELDIDYAGSDYQFFDPIAIERYKEQWCRDPEIVGDLEIEIAHCNALRLTPNPKGHFAMFVPLNAQGRVDALCSRGGWRGVRTRGDVAEVQGGRTVAGGDGHCRGRDLQGRDDRDVRRGTAPEPRGAYA